MLEDILRESSLRHKHICPRQVLGARMSLYAGELLNLDLPLANKRLLVIAETDGCTVDGIMAATGCHVGGRTLRILDLGKVAATFVNIRTEEAIRIAPSIDSRSLACEYAPQAPNRWQAMLDAYKIIPAEELFATQPVQLKTPITEIISTPAKIAICENCMEEIFNGREVYQGNVILCHSCAGECYYHINADEPVNRSEFIQQTALQGLPDNSAKS